jgi:hypothetical protein
LNALTRDLLGAAIVGLILIAVTLAVGAALYWAGFFPPLP